MSKYDVLLDKLNLEMDLFYWKRIDFFQAYIFGLCDALCDEYDDYLMCVDKLTEVAKKKIGCG